MKAGDFIAAWGGIAGAQATLGILLERLAPERVAALTSAHPAERFKLPKGRLEPAPTPTSCSSTCATAKSRSCGTATS